MVKYLFTALAGFRRGNLGIEPRGHRRGKLLKKKIKDRGDIFLKQINIKNINTN